MKTALVIMAAGIGSRFGGGVKQLEPVGPNGEIIMDYSIHDAIAAGFQKIVFIIRRDIESDFREVIGNRIESLCSRLGVEIAYAFQEKSDLPGGCSYSGSRQKPWGTGQAVWACRDVLSEPFAVINADDYYGKEAFLHLHHFLQSYSPASPNAFALAGFILYNTLSENGGVTRGVCQVSEDGFLTAVKETKNIVPYEDGAAVDNGDGTFDPIPANSFVSMNMWAMTPEFIGALENGFRQFLAQPVQKLETAEYLLPIYIDTLLKENKVTVRVLPTKDSWFGVTYKEDKPFVAESFRRLIAAGVYREELFSDLLSPAGV